MTELRTLDMWPAFGIMSDNRWKVAADQYEKKRPGEDNHLIWARPTVDMLNGSKIWGYIPLINVIVGIVRIIFFAKNHAANTPEDKATLRNHILLGIAQILVGPLLLIPDLIATARDASVVKAYLIKHPEAEKIVLGNGSIP